MALHYLHRKNIDLMILEVWCTFVAILILVFTLIRHYEVHPNIVIYIDTESLIRHTPVTFHSGFGYRSG